MNVPKTLTTLPEVLTPNLGLVWEGAQFISHWRNVRFQNASLRQAKALTCGLFCHAEIWARGLWNTSPGWPSFETRSKYFRSIQPNVSQRRRLDEIKTFCVNLLNSICLSICSISQLVRADAWKAWNKPDPKKILQESEAVVNWFYPLKFRDIVWFQSDLRSFACQDRKVVIFDSTKGDTTTAARLC